jgi:phosphoglucomutase
MYLDEYKRWLAAELDDADLKPELAKIEGNDDEIKDRFAVALKFGTAGLRGVLGAGTNRMNIYVVRQATQGLANWVKTQGGSQTTAASRATFLPRRLPVFWQPMASRCASMMP